MKTIDLFPTVTELIRSVIRATVAVIPEDRRRLDVVPIDSATIGRATTCRAIVQQVIAHYATMDDDGMIATSLSLAIDRFTNNQNAARVVQLRHPEVWFLYPIEIVHAQLNAMVYRNEQINGTVTPQAFVDWLVTSGGQAHRVNDLHKKSAIRDAWKWQQLLTTFRKIELTT